MKYNFVVHFLTLSDVLKKCVERSNLLEGGTELENMVQNIEILKNT